MAGDTSSNKASPRPTPNTIEMYAAIALGVSVVAAIAIGFIAFHLARQVREHLPEAPPDAWVRGGRWGCCS